MTAFFDTTEARNSLQFHAAEWVGTPFVAHAMVRGAGADCVHLVAAIYMACGVFAEFKTPQYALDGGLHQRQSQVLTWLDLHPSFIRVHEQPEPGDCLCFRQKLSEHHVGLMLEDGRFIHALENRQAIVSSLDEGWYRKRMTAIYRPLKGRQL